MTRATLLHLLAHPSPLSAGEVTELEQLARAFPYCQTAHLLLAKAAHDQGSMLAGQRLRRAATYAADRRLLRQLIEQPAPVLADLANEASTTVAEEIPAAAPAPAVLPEPVAAPLAAPAADFSNTPAQLEETIEQEPVTVAEQAQLEVLEAPEPAPSPVEETVPVAEPETVEPVAEIVAPEPELPGPAVAAEVPAESAAPAEPTPAPEPEPTSEPEPAVVEDEIPVAALPIRPPADVGAARFEFGLTEEEPAELAPYRLPDIDELLAAAPEPAAAEAPTVPLFTGAPGLGYAFAGGSRLGYALQLEDFAALLAAEAAERAAGEEAPTEAAATEAVLTAATEAIDSSVAPPLTPGSALPAVGEFFEPDALLLDYLAAQPLPAPPPPSSFDLIDSFLKRAPQRRRTGMPPPTSSGPQTDLSVNSARPELELASESLALILTRQGKIERAIAIYERLMVRQPEKMAYFAAQIDLLRTPPALP